MKSAVLCPEIGGVLESAGSGDSSRIGRRFFRSKQS